MYSILCSYYTIILMVCFSYLHSIRRIRKIKTFPLNNFNTNFNIQHIQSTTFLNNYNKVINELSNKNILIVGDGDFSFSKSLIQLNINSTITTTTLDTPQILYKSFPQSYDNIQTILHHKGIVQYEIDATKLSLIYNHEKFDVVFWNFPHVAGKQNIKYNRQLIREFFNDAKHVLNDSHSSSILITLVEGQSGLYANSSIQWNYSWKLNEQVHEAGLIVNDVVNYDPNWFEGYSPLGRRGHGGSFLLGSSEFIKVAKPTNDSTLQAIQAPLYVHEVHLLAPDMIRDYFQFEKNTQEAVREICFEYGFEDALWTVHLVDIYETPKSSHLVSHAIQICYCSLTRSISRSIADSFRRIMEELLPIRMNFETRKEKNGRNISIAYPWFVAEKLRQIYLENELILADNISNKVNGSLVANELRYIESESGIETNCPSSHSESIRQVARLLWRRRAGVLFQKIYN